MISGYTNPIRGMERRLAPDYAQREFRDPGLRSSSGLGSLHRTMPHLRHLTAGAMRLEAGGALPNLAGQIAQSSRPNLYNPDPQFRAALQALTNQPLINRNLTQMWQPTYSYQDGGEAPGTDPEDVMSPEDQQSPEDDHLRNVVLEALAALDGQHPDGKGAIQRFIDAFGPRALADLQQLAEEKHQQQQEEGDQYEEEDEETPEQNGDDDELESAGGGLLEGPGTGQSDEIEGATPSGRPVLLSDGEYVIDAPTVAALGDGSTTAGARRLDELRKQIRRDAYGTDKQAKPMAKGGKALVLRIP